MCGGGGGGGGVEGGGELVTVKFLAPQFHRKPADVVSTATGRLTYSRYFGARSSAEVVSERNTVQLNIRKPPTRNSRHTSLDGYWKRTGNEWS